MVALVGTGGVYWYQIDFLMTPTCSSGWWGSLVALAVLAVDVPDGAVSSCADPMSSLAGGLKLHCRTKAPWPSFVPFTAMEYWVPWVAVNVIFDCSEPL